MITREKCIQKGHFPNNQRFPALIYQIKTKTVVDVSSYQDIFAGNNWMNSWINGIYSFHHYHSNTHEVLGILSGTAQIQLGGPSGNQFKIETGDIIIIPAGVAHKNMKNSTGFTCIGAYPDGKEWDMNYGKPHELEPSIQNIQKTGRPKTDPLFGPDGPLMEYWQ